MAEALALEQALAAVPREQAVSEAEQRAPEEEPVLPVVQEAVPREQAVSEAALPEQVLVRALKQVREAEAQVAGVTVAASLVREPVQARPS